MATMGEEKYLEIVSKFCAAFDRANARWDAASCREYRPELFVPEGMAITCGSKRDRSSHR